MYIHRTCTHKKFKWGFVRACIRRAVYLHVQQLAIQEWPFRVLWLNLLLLFTQFRCSEHFRHKLECIQCLAHVYWTALFCLWLNRQSMKNILFSIRANLGWGVEKPLVLITLQGKWSKECQSQSAQKMRQFVCPGERFLFGLCNLLYSVLTMKRKIWGWMLCPCPQMPSMQLQK